MNWFVIFGLFIFLGVMFYLPVLKYFISPKYFSGLKIVPIVMLAELWFGIFFNLSLWYKLTDRTIWGTWFSLTGLAVTVSVNVIFVPLYGYTACAWAAFTSYGVMMVASYLFGRKYYPINYDIKRAAGYLVLAMGLWWLSHITTTGVNIYDFATRLLLLAVYGGAVYITEVRGPRRKALNNNGQQQ